MASGPGSTINGIVFLGMECNITVYLWSSWNSLFIKSAWNKTWRFNIVNIGDRSAFMSQLNIVLIFIIKNWYDEIGSVYLCPKCSESMIMIELWKGTEYIQWSSWSYQYVMGCQGHEMREYWGKQGEKGDRRWANVMISYIIIIMSNPC